MAIGNIQIDLDGSWVLLKSLGYPFTLDQDEIYERALPQFLELFSKHDVKATFFVNAADLSVPRKKHLIQQIIQEGHEIANHGYAHCYLNQLNIHERREEIQKSTQLLNDLVGRQVKGFRAPGYYADRGVISLLEEQGYQYDCSVFPSSIIFLIKLWEKWNTGKVTTPLPIMDSLLAPLRPYTISQKNLYKRGFVDRSLLEIPVTTLPFLRLPLNFSYGVILGKYYLSGVLSLTRCFNVPMSYVFHLLDMVGTLQDKRLKRYEWGTPSSPKRKCYIESVIIQLKKEYRLLKLEDFKNALES